ncbi:protein kinase, putative [Phytophthora infestans T30-4]|uniref:Protein kinase, putative n=1 Tax=Phytophthora infestans (strain T30-4) TaxID=403677 RepID=D0MQF9_PHYIT|nr:protein kinase, putative [Phytophthora infestans T30-4]EEY57728.1 protein kinase, putative [Phytophthora infestans T30-4]|eukprot:XP_002908914.1 protein kinase, putative [Phytophthora infestans T30-4]
MTERPTLVSDMCTKVSVSDHGATFVSAMEDAVLPSEFMISARVKCARFVPCWVSKRRWVVLRGSKSPILSVYRHDPRRPEDCVPVRMLLLGGDTRMRVVGDKRLVLVSSRVRKDDTLSLEFDTVEQRQVVHETLSRWVSLAVLLQSLSIHESMAKTPNSAVYHCHDCDDPKKQFVLKRVHRSHGHSELNVTARIMQLSREHPELEQCLPQYFYLFEDTKTRCVTVVMKYYAGGSLADRIHDRGPLREAMACNILVSLCRALQLLHENQVLHLDVKASNILFDDAPNGNFSNLKLVDFGSGVNIDTCNITEKIANAGTYGCMAPERFDGSCGPEADVYGAGIVLYLMLSGSIPFSSSDPYQLLARNMIGDINFEEKIWQHVSPRLQSLTARMLAKNPKERITLAEILSLSWLSQEPESLDSASDVTQPQSSN